MDHPVVERVDVAAHGGRRVGVAEDLLDVEQVEVVSSILSDRSVQDARCAPTQVVWAQVPQGRLVGPQGDQLGDAARLFERLAPRDVADPTTGLLAADDRVR